MLGLMRFSASAIANAVAWGIIIALAGLAVVLVAILGPFGLLLLGLFTLLLCTLFTLNEDVPTWGTEVFRARMDHPASPEQRAAMAEERRAYLSPLRFYRWCGIVLIAAGAAGFA